MVSGVWLCATAVAWAASCGTAFAPGPPLHGPHAPGPLSAAAAASMAEAPATADLAAQRRGGAGRRRRLLEGADAGVLAPPVPEGRRSAPGTTRRIVFKGLSTTARGRRLTTAPEAVPVVAAVPKTAGAVAGVSGAVHRTETAVGGAAPLNVTRSSRSSTAHYLRSGEDRARRQEPRNGTTAKAPSKRMGSAKQTQLKMYRNSANVPDSMLEFTEQIRRYALLTAEEEIQLGERIQEAVRLHRLYGAMATQLAREPTDDEWCAAAGKASVEEIWQSLEAGHLAKDRLVVSNLRLVQKVVNMYLRIGLGPQYNAADLMQAGVMALIKAAENFQPNRGWRFSTYALYWIRARVKESEQLQRLIIKVPAKVLLMGKKVVRFERDIYAAVGKRPTHQEICAALDISKEMLDRCYKALKLRTSCYSLNQPLKNRSNQLEAATLFDIVDSRVADQGYSRYDQERLRDDMIRSMHRFLEPQEIELILVRYGIEVSSSGKRASFKNRGATYEELGTIFGTSPSKAKRMTDRILEKLKDMGYEEWLAYL